MENAAGCLAPELQRAADIVGRQICKVGKCCGVELSRGWGLGYGVVVEAIVGTNVRRNDRWACLFKLLWLIGFLAQLTS